MSHTFTITLSDAEYKALGFVAVSQDQWMENAIRERCRVAMEQIVADEVQRKLAAGDSITGSKEEIVLAAQIKTAAERLAEFEAEQAAKQGAQA